MFSIIIPTFNRAKLITRAIDSILNQTFINWELIIVDDGSTDKTERVLKSFLKDKRIKYLKKENTGAAHSRNVGVKHSKQKWIAFLDSDDTWEPNKLQVNFNYIKDNPFSYCFYSSFRIINSQTKRITKEVFPAPVNDMEEQLKNYNPINALPTVVILKNIFMKVGGFDINFKARQDVDLYYRISKLTNFIFISEVLVNIYHNSPDRISASYFNRLSGFELYLKKHGRDMNFRQKSYLAKRIVVYAIKNKSYRIALKKLPLSIWSVFIERFKVKE